MRTKRHFLRKKEVKAFRQRLASSLSERAARILDGQVEVLETETFSLLIVNGDRTFVIMGDDIFPFLGHLVKDDLGMKRVAVDRGAIPYVTNGADVMRPGIVRSDPAVVVDDLVLIVDDTHGKPLAVGRSLHLADELAGGQGKGVGVLHYVGDPIWEFSEA
ncbi:MAG: DUF1947 domain-containing protein [Candidatus Undinarchaeales archaeon]|jgi:PUA domain protein|nr:DUF1947 domain-containing protein [Candidatus Undinarchaeales archaeon]MDP7491690.1 DUF1947 domain-containing protein [Candidatus Undinarchaeales archaeon]